jgi:mono/diheme cytochrome c family protein
MSRVQLEITLGIILVLVTASALVVIGVNENDRMAQFELAQSAQAIEVGAELFDTNCKNCHGIQGEGITGVCPPLNDKHFFEGRMAEVGWTGSLEDYIVSTVSAGRLVSTRPDQFNGFGKPVMPAWSEHYGGPLRDDQIRNIASFILNWESTAGQVTTPTVPVEPVGKDIANIELPEGNAQTGEGLATSKGCAACHVTAPVGPAWAATADEPGVGARAEQRLQDPAYTGKAQTPEQYLLESIVDPHVYLVPPYTAVMPPTYGDTLSAQEVADLIAYMSSLK